MIGLGSRCLIGRSQGCDLRIEEAQVSSEHAIIFWAGAAWELKDLASKNGTWLNGRRLEPGRPVDLAPGDSIALGDTPRRLIFIDAAPPTPRARSLKSGAVREAAGGLLVLPDEERPRVSIVESSDGRWLLETDGDVRPALPREVIAIDGEGWDLCVPDRVGPTLDGAGEGPTLDTIRLQFRVSRNEEDIEILMVFAGTEVPVAPRSHHYMLLTLARVRIATAGMSPAHQGWIEREELCRMLACDENKLNVEVCRARKQLTAMGVLGAANVIERRTGTGRLRLGVARVEVVRK